MRKYVKRSAIDSITQNEKLKIDYDYVMMMRNTIINLNTRWRNFKQHPVELFFSPRFKLWNLIHFITIPNLK